MQLMRILWSGVVVAAVGVAAPPAPNSLPLAFIPNHGQTSGPSEFIVKGSHATAYFTRQDASLALKGTSAHMEFLGATGPQSLEGTDRLEGVANFLIGPEETWRTDVPMYGGLLYRALYPGIDLVYHGSGRNLKAEFIVSPGADPARIQLRYAGADRLRLEDDGALTIRFGRLMLRDEAPIIYQERDGIRVQVEGSFAVAGDVVGFTLGRYDRELPLVIDPVLYVALLGGSDADAATALAVDSTGSAYVAGFTSSYDLPTVNPEQAFSGGGNDAFIAKLNAAGNALVYCTYVGGRGDDRAYGIAVDSTGAAYVTGSTSSSDFPVRNALQPKLGGVRNAFVLKLNAAGNGLIFSTYLGGSSSDTGNGIALDASGNSYVAGDTTSANFPTTALQRSYGGAKDAFVSKLSADGARLVYSTYLGGSNEDHAAAIAVGATGAAFVTGSTYSAGFPTVNSYQATLAGGQDVFVTKFAEDGHSLTFSTYLGGSGGLLGSPEEGEGIAVDGQGNVYIAGVTSSSNFPVRAAAQTVNAGWQDAFAAKFSSSGALIYSTYIGGANIEKANAIAVDAAGNAYVAGETTSPNFVSIPLTQSSSAGTYDGFVVKIAPSGSAVLSMAYVGGAAADTVTAIVVDAMASVYIAGCTQSPNFTATGLQTISGDNRSTFVGKLIFGSASPAVISLTPSSGAGASQTFSAVFGYPGGAAAFTSAYMLINGGFDATSSCYVYYVRSANALYLINDAASASTGPVTPGTAAIVQNSQCSLNAATSSATVFGNTLTLNVSLVFKPAFVGNKTIFLFAFTSSADTGYQTAGTWNVTVSKPTAGPVTPASGSGSSQSFSAVFTNAGGATAFTSAYMLINSVFDANASCYVVYTRSANGFYLINDSASAWTGPVAPGAAATLQNSQCSLNAAASSATISGNTLTLNLALVFKPPFVGSKTLFLFAVTPSADTGFQPAGTWTVDIGSPPSAGPVTPASGSGSSQAFSANFTNAGGAAAFTSAYILINSVFDATASCYVYYVPSADALYLINDSASAFTGPVTPGAAATLQNSQCTLNAAGSSAKAVGNTLTLNVALVFKPGFAGSKTIYLFAFTASAGTGFQTSGTWTVSTVPPTAGPVTPANGSGSAQTFSAVFANPGGAATFTSAYILINSVFNAQASCYIYYAPSVNAIYLINDSASGWTGPVTPGSATTVQNSQCTLNAAGSSATISGNTLTLNVALVFKPAFAGSKTLFLFAFTPSANTGYQTAGKWTVP